MMKVINRVNKKMRTRLDINDGDIIKKYQAGFSASELSRIYNTTPGTIIQRLRKNDIVTRTCHNYITDRISKRLQLNQTGNNNSNYKGTQIKFMCEHCNAEKVAYDNGVRKFRFCSNKCSHAHIKHPTKGKTGKLHPAWKEIKKKSFRKHLRFTYEYKNWRTDIFIRDDYRCQKCGIKGGVLEAHHIIPFSKILDSYLINTYEQAIECEQLWNTDNGITYCVKCHAKIDKNRNI